MRHRQVCNYKVYFDKKKFTPHDHLKKYRIDTKDKVLAEANDNDNNNDNEIYLFRHHNENNTNIKVIFKLVNMLDKCNRI